MLASTEGPPDARASSATSNDIPHRSAPTLIVGLGSPILGDDAVGLHVARRLHKLLPKGTSQVLELEAAGLRLLEVLPGYHRAMLIDAMLPPDPASPCPGRLHSLTPDDLAGSRRLSGSHDADLGTALALARELAVPLPPDLLLFGIEVTDVWHLHEGLSAAVAAAVPRLAALLADRLAQL